MMLVSDLGGPMLDYWAARARGLAVISGGLDLAPVVTAAGLYSPSTRWDQGGPIIHDLKLSLCWVSSSPRGYHVPAWHARPPFMDDVDRDGYGDTPLEAAVRACVAYAFGEEVGEDS